MGNTIKNNDPETTFYSLSIRELANLCTSYHEIADDEDFWNVYTFIELEVDNIKKGRK